MHFIMPREAQTISRDAFVLVLDALRTVTVKHYPIAALEGPALIIEGSPEALEHVRVIAEDHAKLYAHLEFDHSAQPVTAELKVWGFERVLVPKGCEPWKATLTRAHAALLDLHVAVVRDQAAPEDGLLDGAVVQ